MSTQTERLVATIDGDSSGLQKSLRSAKADAEALDTALESAGQSAAADFAAGLEQAAKATADQAAAAKAAANANAALAASENATRTAAQAAAADQLKLAQEQQQTAASASALADAEARAAAGMDRLGSSSKTAGADAVNLGKIVEAQRGAVATTAGEWGRFKGVIDGAVTKMGPAGEMVNKITTLMGPLGLAVGGVTGALVGANLAVGAFNDATTRMLEKTDEGRAVLAAIEPQFVSFGKVLSEQFEAQRDLIDVGARAQAVNAAWGDVLRGLTAPFVAFGQLLGAVGDAFLGVEERAAALRAELARQGEMKQAKEVLDRYKAGLASINEAAAAFIKSQTQGTMSAVEEGNKLLNDVMVVIANRVAARMHTEQGRIETFEAVRKDIYRAMREATEEERDLLLGLAEARDKAAEAEQRSTAASREAAVARASRPAPRPTGPSAEDAAGAAGTRMAAEMAAQARAMAEESAAREQARFDALVAHKSVEMQLTEKQMALNVQAKAVEEGQHAKVLEQQQQEQAARKETLGIVTGYVSTFTRSMAAVTIAQAKDGKERSRMYRTAVADQIQALGDYAATKAIVSAAEGNFIMAATLATAAATAYATASIMRPSQAPSAAAAGAAPAAQQAPPQLTTINNTLVVNDAFSDTEQVSRRFAQVYRGANDRGLLPAGA